MGGGGSGTDAWGLDADVVTNWNGHNFDLPYLENRAKLFGIDADFAEYMSRVRWSPMRITEAFAQSGQNGKRQCNKIAMGGRLAADMMVYVQQEGLKVPSYKLDAVAETFLGDHKDDVHFTQIAPMWLEGVETRTKLCEYCLKDAQLPRDIARKLNAFLNIIERARITGVPCDWVMGRGAMVRFNSLLFREALKQSYVIPYVAPPPFTTGSNQPSRQRAAFQVCLLVCPSDTPVYGH